MKLKKILAAVAAAAVAVSTMAVSAFAIDVGTYVENWDNGGTPMYTAYLVADDGKPQWAVDNNFDVTTIYGVTFNCTFDADKAASWIGGAVGANSNSTGWKQIEFSTDGGKEITPDIENGTITWKSSDPIFKADDKYVQLWIADYSKGGVTVKSVDLLDKDGNVISGAAEAAPVAEAAPAVTVELDAEYPGDWGAGKCISKSDLEAIGGDVKVVLTVEASNISDDSSYVFRPMDYDNSWTGVTDKLTAEQAAAKPDGMMQVKKDQTTVEFVVPADVVASLGASGLGFQVNNVTIKSAEISAGAPENPLATVEDADTPAYCNGTFEPEWPKAAPAAVEETTAPAAEEAPEAEEAEDEDVDVDVEPEEEEEEAEPVAETEAPAVEEAPAPAVENATAAPATGNTAAASIVAVMAVAGVAAIAAKKRK
ncbi:MAG: hypothetical protein HDT25_00220 [Ruminococcus sp.]|nr:hypothetical protein [Ruminococcus sp.]